MPAKIAARGGANDNAAPARHSEKIDPAYPVIVLKRRRLMQGGMFREHWHEHLQFLLVTAGELSVHCNAGALRLGPGGLAVINGGELHYIEAPRRPVSFSVIKFDPRFLFSWTADACQTKYAAPLAGNLFQFNNGLTADKEAARLARRMLREHEAREWGFELAVKAAAMELLALLLRRHFRGMLRPRGRALRDQAASRLRLVFEYIEGHFCERITLDELARRAHMSRNHLCRQFKRACGMTAVEYQTGLRLRKAAALLRAGEMNVTEAAVACGFDDSNYFSRVFRRQFGAAPRKFRQQQEK